MTVRCAGRIRRALTVGAVLLAAPLAVQAAPGQDAPAGAMNVLGDDSYLRAYLVFKTPVFATAAGEVKVALDPMAKTPTPIGDFQSPLPPEDWRKPEFDDSTWARDRAPVEMGPGGATGRSPAALHTATPNSLICLRGKFVVSDVAKVRDLSLSLEYVGGVAVYVNGTEVARAHLPAGPLAPDTLAEAYPGDLYVEPNGMFLQDIRKNPAGFERRYRRLTGVAIPSALLRKGTNVLAIEVHRAPANEGAIEAKRVPVGGMYVVPGLWAYSGLRSCSLTAAAGSAVTPNVARPAGVQVWNCLPYETIQAIDYGDPGEPLRPVIIPALRNGVFSGRFVVSSDAAILGLKVTISELAERPGGARIPASAVQVRYAVPAEAAKSWAPTYRFDGLLDAIPTEVSVVRTGIPRETYMGEPIGRKGLSVGALAPIWITVRVPADAKAGTYEGTVQVAADGLETTTVPVRLVVNDWALPDPKDFRTRNLGFVSPESLARHYGVPLWSDRHFELIGRSLAQMAEIGSRQVLVNLAIGFYGGNGNQESVVRWVREADGSYTHDFTVLDKFLDAIAKSIEKPLPIRFNCWGEVAKDGQNWANVKTVSLLDRKTGEVSAIEQPAPGTPEAVAFWRPVLDGVRQRVEARGWYDVTALGHNSYCWPRKPVVIDLAKAIWPDGVWGYTAHNGQLGGAFGGTEKGVSMPVRYSECVWTEGRLSARGYRSLVGPRQNVWCTAARNRYRDGSPLTVVRLIPEEMFMRGQDGVGQTGADLFPIKNVAGRYFHIDCGRGGLGPDCSTLAILYPGDKGPIGTERYEMFREGVQVAETILALQRALDRQGLAGDLADRVNRYLDDRAEAFLRRWAAERFEREARLFALAADVAAQTAR